MNTQPPARLLLQGSFIFFAVLSLTQALAPGQTPPLPDLATIPADLTVPEMKDTAPAAGLRVRQTTPGWEGTQVHHALYLPTDWSPPEKGTGRKYPVIAEYAGNGGYKNKYGDVSEGSVQGSNLGYGLSGGHGFLWVCLPYIENAEGTSTKRNAIKWWGDVAETNRYATATLKMLAEKYGADLDRVVLAGFSRGAIGCNYLGLQDDTVAPQWKAFFCHSHYDGVSDRWPYAGADRTSALARLQRLKGRPQWLSQEGSTKASEEYLKSTGVKGDFTFHAIPFRNHSDQWLLRDIPERKAAREWLHRVIGETQSNEAAKH
jgi:hypothetical protein